MPPGTLDFITIRDRDVDGIAGSEIVKDPENPNSVKLKIYSTPGPKDSENIQGFSSDQL